MAPGADGSSGLQILVVDDEPVVGWTLATGLIREGHRVVVREDAPAALALLRDRPFDYLITDYRMPEIDGLELAQRARRLSPTMAVILITASRSLELEERARALGIELLEKPLDAHTLAGHLSPVRR